MSDSKRDPKQASAKNPGHVVVHDPGDVTVECPACGGLAVLQGQ